MALRFPTLCAVAALAVGLSACAAPSEPARTAAAGRPANATTAEALARIANQSLDAGDPASAVSMLKRAHELDPSSAAILADLGRNLSALKAWSESAEAYRKAAALAPNDPAIRRGYGGALLALDQPALAEQEYRAAVAVREDAGALCGLGVTLDLQGRHDEAETAFRKAYQLDPAGAATRTNLALSLALWGASDEAIGLLAPMAAGPDAAAKQRQNLALVFGLAGERDQAAAVARIDLGEEAVRSNLAYYETLRALSPVLRMRALMGRHDTEPPQPPRKPALASSDDAPAVGRAPAATPEPTKRAPAKPSRTAERSVPTAAKAAVNKAGPSRIPVPAVATADGKRPDATPSIVEGVKAAESRAPETDAAIAATNVSPVSADAPIVSSERTEPEAPSAEELTGPVAAESAEVDAAPTVAAVPEQRQESMVSMPAEESSPATEGTIVNTASLPQAETVAEQPSAGELMDPAPSPSPEAVSQALDSVAAPSESQELAEAPTPLLPQAKADEQRKPEASVQKSPTDPAVVMAPPTAESGGPGDATP